MREVNYDGRTSLCEQLLLLSYSTGRTVIRCWARPVSDSQVSCYII